MAHLLKRNLSRYPSAAYTCLILLQLSAMASSDANVQECQKSSACADEKLSAEILDIADEGGPNLVQTRAWLQHLTDALAKKHVSSKSSEGVGKSAWADLSMKLEDLKANLDLARTTSEVQASLVQESSHYLENMTMEAEGVQARFGRDMAVIQKAGNALQRASRAVMSLEGGEATEFSGEVQVGEDLLASIKGLQKIWNHHAGVFGYDEADAMNYALFKASQAEKSMKELKQRHNSDLKSVKAILTDAADAAKVIMTMTEEHRAAADLKGTALQTVGALKARTGDCHEASKAILLTLSDATQKAQDAQRALKQGHVHVTDQVTRLEEKLKEAEEEKAAAREDAAKAEQATAETMQVNREALQELRKLRALNKDLEAQLQSALTEKSKTHHHMEYMKTQLDLASSQLRSPQEALNMLSEAGKHAN